MNVRAWRGPGSGVARTDAVPAVNDGTVRLGQGAWRASGLGVPDARWFTAREYG